MSSLTHWIRSACRREVLARKPGNVHPGAAFEDLCCEDFLRSADVAAPWLAQAAEQGVGLAILRAVEATQAAVGRNTNLGIALLLGPLAAVPLQVPLRYGIDGVLHALTIEDAVHVYRAIRCVAPAGLGRVEAQDVADEPTETLLAVMQRAADRDTVARQYASGFADVLDFGRSVLARWEAIAASSGHPLPDELALTSAELPVVGLQLELLARSPDSLIARKCGPDVAAEASRQAAALLAGGWPHGANSPAEFAAFDHWLRATGHRRNPGTTADLIAAVLFAAERDAALFGPASGHDLS